MAAGVPAGLSALAGDRHTTDTAGDHPTMVMVGADLITAMDMEGIGDTIPTTIHGDTLIMDTETITTMVVHPVDVLLTLPCARSIEIDLILGLEALTVEMQTQLRAEEDQPR